MSSILPGYTTEFSPIKSNNQFFPETIPSWNYFGAVERSPAQEALVWIPNKNKNHYYIIFYNQRL